MAKKEQNFVMHVGNTKEIAFTVDLVGSLNDSAIVWALSDNKGGTALVTKSKGLGITVNGSVATVLLSSDDTKNLRPGRYYHEMEITDGVGYKVTAAIGQVRLRPTIIT